jgi:cytidine deaminase
MPQSKNTILVQAAAEARDRAIAPFSHFQVGAALQSKAGRIYSGCNIEVSSYSLTLCAERVALFKALSEGERDFECMVIATYTEPFCPPCGACRQVLMDFAPDLTVILCNAKRETRKMQLRDLFPQAFGRDFLAPNDD